MSGIIRCKFNETFDKPQYMKLDLPRTYAGVARELLLFERRHAAAVDDSSAFGFIKTEKHWTVCRKTIMWVVKSQNIVNLN